MKYNRALAVAMLSLAFIICTNIFSIASQLVWVDYTVKLGDSLWSIAEENKPNNMRYDEYMYEIMERNDITPDIHVGQEIKILREEDENAKKSK